MCLTTVNRTYEKNDTLEIGYKRFQRGYFGATYELHDNIQCDQRKIGRMYNATNQQLYSSQVLNKNWRYYSERVFKKYDAGFHFYPRLEQAIPTNSRNWKRYNNSRFIVCEVAVWDIRAKGKQSGHVVWVGKHMRVIRPITKEEFESVRKL